MEEGEQEEWQDKGEGEHQEEEEEGSKRSTGGPQKPGLA